MPMAMKTSPAFSSSASASKLPTPLGLPSGTTSATLFSRRLSRLPCSPKSSPSGFFSASQEASSWFICLGAAEMNTSQSAPSWIWVLSVPEESKLYVMVTPGLAVSYIPLISVSVSVMDAAAKTMISTGSTAGSSAGAASSAGFSSAAGASDAAGAAGAAGAAVLPHAASAKIIVSASSNASTFFMGFLLLPVFQGTAYLYKHGFTCLYTQGYARNRLFGRLGREITGCAFLIPPMNQLSY